MEPVFEFPLDLDKRGRENLARRLHQRLRAAIVEKRLPAGAPLPSTRRVAQAYGLARNTVIAAYDLLMAEGFIVTRPGAPARVADLGLERQSAGRKRAPQVKLAPSQAGRKPAPRASNRADAQRFQRAVSPSFALGVPDYRWFPSDIWRRLLLRASSLASADSFGYPPAEGRPLLRAAIAQHVAYARAVVCTDRDVVVTSGAQQAFHLLAQLLVTRGHTKVAIENPGYTPAASAMLAAGAQVVPVPVDDEGLVVESLPSDVSIVYVTPSHQFPTGVAMSLARRRALLEFARRNAAVIIEDDYDGEFRYGTHPLDALQTLDRDAKVIYVGTFSKSMFPSLRLGYIVAPAWMAAAIAAARESADNGSNVATQDTLAQFILDGHLARYTRAMRNRYASRRDTLLKAIERELGDWLIAVPPSAGIHLYARYRDRRQAKRIATLAQQHARGVLPVGDVLVKPDSTGGSGIAFGFGFIDEAEIEQSIEALGRALRKG